MTDAPKSGLLYASLLVWGALFAWSFAAYLGMEPEGDGFTRGLNRVSHFFGWQIAAMMMALVCYGLARHQPRRSLARRLGHVPLVLAGLLFLGLAGIVAVTLWTG